MPGSDQVPDPVPGGKSDQRSASPGCTGTRAALARLAGDIDHYLGLFGPNDPAGAIFLSHASARFLDTLPTDPEFAAAARAVRMIPQIAGEIEDRRLVAHLVALRERIGRALYRDCLPADPG